ncbi:hypothetical protein ABIA99_004265 [Bradyrhizobium sp. LB12.1]|uniref:hypothetical protein n=1 Tax=Bradyrhizobium sp. LB12.1 TaxID=3156327 RepID=UPI00339A9FBB
MSGHFSQRKRYEFDVEAWVQFKLLRLAAHHPETTKADVAVLAEVVQRYWGKYGNGFVSDEEICALAGINERTVRRARKNLTRLGFVQVVRAGGRGHATVYTPNFGLVPQKSDILVLDKKADISVRLTDENVRLNGELPDILTRPSSLRTGLQTGTQIERHDSAAPTAPDGVGPVGATPPGSAQEELSLQALLASYCPADMSRPARTAYKRAWEAIPQETDLGMVVDAGADWHQAWAAQNNPEAPRMSLVRWLKDEMYLRPAPKGFSRVEKPSKAKSPSATKPASTGTTKIKTCVITDYAEEGSPFAEWYVTIDFKPEDGGPFSRRLHVLTRDGDGPDLDAYNAAARAVFGKDRPVGQWVGRYVGVDKSGYWHLPDYQEPEPAPAPRRLTAEEAQQESYLAWCAENDC